MITNHIIPDFDIANLVIVVEYEILLDNFQKIYIEKISDVLSRAYSMACFLIGVLALKGDTANKCYLNGSS